ncbi:MAG: Tad domain-containing protein, partial [Aldersonia sp.]|nr:Tad domain-containing protein [Aldersonia sp.]
MRRFLYGHRREEGQALVLFVISLVAIIGMTGLVLDGGGAFAQRRAQQNVADLAAMAGAVAYANNNASVAAAETRAREIATLNGFTSGVNSTTVAVTVQKDNSTGAATVHVMVARPHRNSFAGVLGQPSWDVGAEATAITGIPNASAGTMPIIFNEAVFDGSQP